MELSDRTPEGYLVNSNISYYNNECAHVKLNSIYFPSELKNRSLLMLDKSNRAIMVNEKEEQVNTGHPCATLMLQVITQLNYKSILKGFTRDAYAWSIKI